MDLEILKSIILEGQKTLIDLDIVKRDFVFEEAARYVFVGIRQAGKSYLLFWRAMQLIAQGHIVEEMLFINFDDERLVDFKIEDMDSILKAYTSLFPHKPILFLDEIQNIEGWEHFARRLANSKYMVYITGSNAKMLSSDISTVLGGRYLENHVFPYSFKEFLEAQGVILDTHWQYTDQKGQVERLLSSYFHWGGFPELGLFRNKRAWLNQLYDKIILGDIIQRNKIRNELALRLAVKRLAENVKNPTSYLRLANMVNGTGVKTNVTSVMEYVDFCKDACLLFSLDNYASKFVEKNTVKKHYFIDNGLLSIFLTDSETSLLENICAVTLYRRYCRNAEAKVYYYKKDLEMDFYIPSENRGVQASFSLHDASTSDREVKALLDFHRKYGLDYAEIVTYSEDRIIHTDTIDIHVVPLSRWLIDKEQSD